jgi:hypothetical protein
MEKQWRHEEHVAGIRSADDLWLTRDSANFS